eukprot:scaffold94169_cov66-Phaeocystis_antarctica.AAC.1
MAQAGMAQASVAQAGMARDRQSFSNVLNGLKRRLQCTRGVKTVPRQFLQLARVEGGRHPVLFLWHVRRAGRAGRVGWEASPLAAWQLPRVGPWMASIADEGARRGWRARGARHATRPADWRTHLFSARNGRVTSNLPARNAASLINSITSGTKLRVLW